MSTQVAIQNIGETTLTVQTWQRTFKSSPQVQDEKLIIQYQTLVINLKANQYLHIEELDE